MPALVLHSRKHQARFHGVVASRPRPLWRGWCRGSHRRPAPRLASAGRSDRPSHRHSWKIHRPHRRRRWPARGRSLRCPRCRRGPGSRSRRARRSPRRPGSRRSRPLPRRGEGHPGASGRLRDGVGPAFRWTGDPEDSDLDGLPGGLRSGGRGRHGHPLVPADVTSREDPGPRVHPCASSVTSLSTRARSTFSGSDAFTASAYSTRAVTGSPASSAMHPSISV